MTVYVKTEPDERGRFLVLVRGYMEQWTIDRIKAHVGNGGGLEEWK